MACVMKVSALMPVLLLGACSMNTTAPDAARGVTTPMSASHEQDAQREATLLVNREDGSVIRQTINIDADLCFKQISSSETTCFRQGDPIVNPETNLIVGYEMIEDHIDLIPRY